MLGSPPPKSFVEILTPNMVVLEVGPLGVIGCKGRVPTNGVSALRKRPRQCSGPSAP